jgi:hypothetical protein
MIPHSAEVIQAGGEILLVGVHKTMHSIWSNEELPDERKEPMMVPVHKKGDKIDCNKYLGIIHTKFYELFYS